jgi:hypothetical protein
MTAGKLAAAKPAASTNTILYRSKIGSSASTVLNVTNQGASGATYRVALRDYDQTLTLDSSSYKFRKGNVVSSYILNVSPGVQNASLTPGALVNLASGKGSFRYMDVFVDDAVVYIPTKVDTIGSFNISATPTGGTFTPGNTITAQYGTVTTTIYSFITNTLQLITSLANVTSGQTSVRLASLSQVQATDYIAAPSVVAGGGTPGTTVYELILLGTITTGTRTAAITRAQLGTTGAEHYSGSSCYVIRPTATTTTLSAAITDTAATSITLTSTTGMVIGNYLRIGNEILNIAGISGTTVTVTRGSFSTTAATALNGATVTYLTDNGRVILNFYDNGETITSGGTTATVSYSVVTQNPFNPGTKFVYDTNNDGIFENLTGYQLNIGRTYRFTQTHASNTAHTLRFQQAGASSEYTTGVTISGTAGNSGAYSEIVINALTPSSLTTYDSTTSGFGMTLSVNSNPYYDKIYVYDVEGDVIAAESFSTSTGSNDILSVYAGPYGYVHDYTSTALKVSLGLNSSTFVDYTTSITGSSGSFTITVGSAANLIIGQYVSGTGIATNARISGISGTTISLNIANSGAVSGTGTFRHALYDSPRQTGTTRLVSKVSGYTGSIAVNDEDYIFYDKALASKSTDKNSSIVVGPGQSIVVQSSALDISYHLNGFEDTSNDYTIYNYNRV